MSRSNNFRMECSACGRRHPRDAHRTKCIACTAPLLIRYEAEAVVSAAGRLRLDGRAEGVWRYLELLPIIEPSHIVSLGEGGTFLHRCERLAKALGLERLYVKDETTNPTGSFIDRGSSVAVTHYREIGVGSVCSATTGNLGASLSAYAAKAGLDCTVFVPRYIDIGKLYQMIAYGSRVEPVGSYEEAVAKAASLGKATQQIGPGDPYFSEGEKTTGFEICEQLGWRTPERIVVPMGDGGHVSMIWKGIEELYQANLLYDINAKMTGVQLERLAPIAKAFLLKEVGGPLGKTKHTFASDIAVRRPTMSALAVQTIKESRGSAVTVSDREILDAMSLLAKTEGIFAEPAAASTVAGVKKLLELGQVTRDEEVVCVITGAGLKDPVSAKKLVQRSVDLNRIIRGVEGQTLVTRLGLTKLRVLELCKDREAYGYSIWRTMGDRFKVRIKIPSVYQHLSELENMRLIEGVRAEKSLGRPERVYYRLTKKGEKVLESFKQIERGTRTVFEPVRRG